MLIGQLLIQELVQVGQRGGKVSAKAHKKYLEEEDLMNEHMRDHPLVAERKRNLGYASEDTESEIERLKRLGHMKSSAYMQGFMTKVAQLMKRPPRISVLKASILYNRPSLMARLRRP